MLAEELRKKHWRIAYEEQGPFSAKSKSISEDWFDRGGSTIHQVLL